MIVSCIIPTYKKFETLWTAIDSVLMQDYKDIELIITDDGSDNIDESAIRNYIENNKYKNIIKYHVLTHIKNVGTVRNMNSAIEASSGEIIFNLSSDDRIASEDVISRVVDRFIETNANVLVCSRIKCSEDMKSIIRLMPHQGYLKYINRKMNTAEKQYVHMALGCGMEFASGSSMYFKKDFFFKMGGYSQEYLLWEDGPFISKITRNGFKIVTAYDIKAIYYRDGGISSKKKKDKELSRIEIDYFKAIDNEYLKYKERFSKRQIRIINGRYEMFKNNEKNYLKAFIKYPDTIINMMYVKVKKLICRLLLIHLGGKNEIKGFK